MGLFNKKKEGPSPETVERVKEFARQDYFETLGENTAASTLDIHPIKTPEELEEEKWEQRRWELTRYLVAQDRRSVVLGKLNSSASAIARKARQLADATILELRNHKLGSDGGKD